MTAAKLLRDLATACAQYQDEHLRNLKCRRIECNEILALCLREAEERRASEERPRGCRDLKKLSSDELRVLHRLASKAEGDVDHFGPVHESALRLVP